MDHLLNSEATPLRHVLVCGSGLAAQMTVAALSAQASHIRVTWLKVPGSDALDILYGNVAPPQAYDFNLAIGLDEPALMLNSNTAFSYGTRYVDWGPQRRSWIQVFHAPFPVLNGVLFYHYALRMGHHDLSPLLTPAVAAQAGVFAHPPEDPRHPLARAEYGYQFEAGAYGAVVEQGIPATVTRIETAIAGIQRNSDGIGAIELADGQVLTADLYIDCTGPEGLLAGQAPQGRALSLLASHESQPGLGAPLRTVTAGAYGWTAQTPVQDGVLRLTVHDQTGVVAALAAHGGSPARLDFTVGHRDAAWIGNCVAIGQAAGVVEPVTPAPLLLLMRDIERLVSLLPVSPGMAVERREYNRQYGDDYRHAALFNRALFVTDGAPEGAYWTQAAAEPIDERLAGKIEQYDSRGLHVAYDLEPFGLEDWVIQHFGMGRRPARHDRMADQPPAEVLERYFADLTSGIAQAVRSMPPHAVYRDGLVKFLKQQGQ